MADKKEEAKLEVEKKIPVFTVLKSNSILKNIFLLDSPPSISNFNSIQNVDGSIREPEEILLVGRHPDCSITLEHPSISRYHLRIHSNPSSQKLSVIDLSSVHGTWVSGKKIKPGDRVQLNEGDTMQLGGSSRIYRLHWVPLSRAYDLDDPFMPPLDGSVPVEEREEEEEETHQDDICLGVQSPGDKLEGLDLLFSNNNLKSCLKKVCPSAPQVPEYLDSTYYDVEEVEIKSPSRKDREQKPWDESVPVKEREKETRQDYNRLGLDNSQIQSPGDKLEGLDLLFSDKNLKSSFKKVCSFAPEVPEYLDSSYYDGEEVENKSPSRQDHEQESLDELVHVKEREKETHQDEHFLGVENNQIQPLGDELEGLDLLFSNKNLISSFKKVCSSAPPVPEYLNSSDYDEEEVVDKSQSSEDHENSEIYGICYGPLVRDSDLPETENQQIDTENQIPPPLLVSGILSRNENLESPNSSSLEQNFNLLEFFKSSFSDEEIENLCLSRKCHEQEISRLGCPQLPGTGTSSFPCSIVSSVSKDQNNFDKENPTPETFLTPGKSEQQPNFPGILNSSLSNESVCPVAETFEVAESQSLLREDHEQKRILRESDSEHFEKENRTPQSFGNRVSQIKDSESPLISSEQRSNLRSIWSRRGKPASVRIQTAGKSKGKSKRVNTDAEFEQLEQECTENKSISKDLFARYGDEEETFTPDKENFTPKIRLLRSMKKSTEENKHSKSYRSSSLKKVNSVGPNIHQEEDVLASSDKENQTPKVLQERKSVKPTSRHQARLEPEVMKNSRVTRVPFQSLLANSSSQSKSKATAMDKITNPHLGNTVGGENKKWIMVVDTNCLLNKESRKALQLLQGLKGTQLIIPRIVIRELDCMKRRGSLFRRTTEVSSALLWIEECMVNTKWWIHVQSSVEEGRPIAPTPPATPLSQLSEESEGFPFSSVPFSALGSLLKIVSPTAEDHILECALLFRRIVNDGQLVLLSESVAVKIKAMAEGLICEAAEEFRETLVNPFSERFLWVDSSPRGHTWSCVDDIVLREKYCGWPLKKPSKLGEGAKGLKLLLLHSSHYRHINSAC